MDAQIIISREDNTDFTSIGFIQTDTSLVSALGGALANFAEEIGLGGDKSTDKKKNAINFSKFQNGILASKMVRVKEHTPIILIAIKGFTGEDKDLDFVVEYATKLAEVIVTKFEGEYSSIGLIPRIEDAYEQVAQAANHMYRSSSAKTKYFTKNMKGKITTILDSIWDDQQQFEIWAQDYTQKKISHMSQNELQIELAKYFYIQGLKADAFFPLVFASSANPMAEVSKLVEHFLKKKTASARKELINEITKIIIQLKESSKALSKRDMVEIPEVELINESYIFEKILVTKTDLLEKTIVPIIADITKDLYRKLFRKNPLKFVAMSKESVFDKKELDNIIKKVLDTTLKQEIADKTWISDKISVVLRDVSSKYSPNDIMRKQKQILDKIYTEFINLLKKEHPFVIIADPSLKSISQFIRTEAAKILDRFSTTLDEAVILYNSIGQIHSTISKEKDPSAQDLMILYFLQQVIQPYQFRQVPSLVYSLIIECFSKTSYGRKTRPEELIRQSIAQFEKKLDFKIIPVTKKQVLTRMAKAKPTLQRFETLEDLSYFFKSFRTSLESTLTKILQRIFGPEKLPMPPVDMIKTINRVACDVQSIFVVKSTIDKIVRRPNGRDLFSKNSLSYLVANTKFKHILPSPLELSRLAYNSGWMKSLDQKKIANITVVQLKALKVKIPTMKCEGPLMELLEKPLILENLWINFAAKVIESRQGRLKKSISDLDKRAKTSAGSTIGKQKFGSISKRLKGINKWLTNILSGGGALRKLFAGNKDLHLLASDSSKEIYSSFRYHPEKAKSYTSQQTIKSITSISPIDGDFQDLMQLYASLWLADSQYIDNIIDSLFWDGVMKTNGPTNDKGNLENKINANLRTAYKKESIRDKQGIILNAIVEEVVPSFNKIIRTALADAFTIFKDDRIVNFAEKTNDWYISFGTANIPINALKFVFKTMKNISLVKEQEDVTEIRLLLTEHYSLKRSKETQTIEEFIRKASFNQLNKMEVKALEFFGDLNEKYIGKSAADTFYSYIRSLAQMIITPVT